MVLNNRWDSKIALRYFEYLCFLSWEYEAIIVRDLLLDNHVSLAGEFCLETELVKDGLCYFRDDAIWRGKDYDSDIIPASMNADADADILKYRKYGLVDVYKNKRAGIFMCTKAK